jgi:phenylalanyl-tRNA synthetase alpha chain
MRTQCVAHRAFSSEAKKDPYDNIPQHITDLTQRRIYSVAGHPLHTLIGKIEGFFTDSKISDLHLPNEKFRLFKDFDPLVKVEECFDLLGIPEDHASRRTSDTYYKSRDMCLRPHTSVHQIPLMRQGHSSFLCVGDVYRKDTVDRTHYPAFHQMEGVRTYGIKEIGAKDVKEAKIIAERDLK